MPHFTIVTKIFTTQRLTRGESVLRLFDIVGGIHGKLENYARGGGVYFQENWVGVCGPLPKTLALFMTKICDIPYPIYDLTKNSKPNL